MLKGQAKTDYQRRYMREHRLNKQDVRPPEMKLVRPVPMPDTQPQKLWLDADDNPVYDTT